MYLPVYVLPVDEIVLIIIYDVKNHKSLKVVVLVAVNLTNKTYEHYYVFILRVHKYMKK